jgi:ribosomal protein L39E
MESLTPHYIVVKTYNTVNIHYARRNSSGGILPR